jgi:hypothetical protein
MDIRIIIFQDSHLVSRKGKASAANIQKVDEAPDWQMLISDSLNQPLSKEDFFVIFDPKGQANYSKTAYVFLESYVNLTEDFEAVNLRLKDSLTKEDQNTVRNFIEFAILKDCLPEWGSAIKYLYFSGESPLWTPRRLENIEGRAQTLRAEGQMSTTTLLMSLVLPIFLGAVADHFFYGHRFGISVILFLCLFSGVVLWKRKTVQINLLSVLFAISALGLSLSFSIFNNETLRALNTLLLPFATTGFYLTLLHKEWGKVHFRLIHVLFGKIIGAPLFAISKLVVPFKRLITPKQLKVDQRIIQIGFGIIIALPVLLIIISLLAGSDEIFNQGLIRLFDFEWLKHFDLWVEHGIVISVLALYFFGYLWHMNASGSGYEMPKMPKRYLETITMITFLSIILIVYTVFSYIQVKYLFLQGALPEGFTYAEYARTGFFQLLAATCFNGLILILVHRGTKYETSGSNPVVKGMLTLLVGFSLMLLYTGFYRMFLYEAAYGYTELRLFVLFFMAFIGLSLLLVCLWIWKESVPLFKGILILSMVFYMALNYINIDATIAYKNIHHASASEILDESHLSWLSVDAYPVLKSDLIYHPNYKEILQSFEDNHNRETYSDMPWFSFNFNMSQYLNETEK